jgi:hypothetical protein
MVFTYSLSYRGVAKMMKAEDIIVGIEGLPYIWKQQVEKSPAVSVVEWINKIT